MNLQQPHPMQNAQASDQAALALLANYLQNATPGSGQAAPAAATTATAAQAQLSVQSENADQLLRVLGNRGGQGLLHQTETQAQQQALAQSLSLFASQMQGQGHPGGSEPASQGNRNLFAMSNPAWHNQPQVSTLRMCTY